MSVEVKVPSPGESVSEVEIASWLVADGDYVEKDQEIVELDSDKATLAMPAEESGILTITVEEGESVEVGQVIATIDTDAQAPEGAREDKSPASKDASSEQKPAQEEPQEKPQSPAAEASSEKSYAAGSPSPAARKILTGPASARSSAPCAAAWLSAWFR